MRRQNLSISLIKMNLNLKFDQTIVVIKPTIIPEIIPYLVVFFHHKVITNAGPNEEPKPLQA